MRTLAGAILMAIGVLIAGTAGLCGGIMLVFALSYGNGVTFSEAVMAAVMILVGCGLFFAGYAIQKEDRRN